MDVGTAFTQAQGGGQGEHGQVTCTGSGHVVGDPGSASNRPWARPLLGPQEVTNPLAGLEGVHVRRPWWVGDAVSLKSGTDPSLCLSVPRYLLSRMLLLTRVVGPLPCASGTGLDPTPPLPPDLLRWDRHHGRPRGGASWPAGGCQASRGDGQRVEPVGRGRCPGDLA